MMSPHPTLQRALEKNNSGFYLMLGQKVIWDTVRTEKFAVVEEVAFLFLAGEGRVAELHWSPSMNLPRGG